MRLSAIFSSVVAAVLAAPLAAAPVFEVGHVAADDVLNVRQGPSTQFEIVQGLPPAYGNLTKLVCVLVKPDPHKPAPARMSEWCMISEPGNLLGWVNARFLVPDRSPAPSTLRFIAGYRSYEDLCQLVGESDAVIDFLDHTADLVGCPVGDPGIEVLKQEMGAMWVGEIEGYVLLSVPNQ